MIQRHLQCPRLRYKVIDTNASSSEIVSLEHCTMKYMARALYTCSSSFTLLIVELNEI